MIITGLLTLTQRLLCRNEVLGKEFNACISGFNVNIFFPRYNYDKVINDPERVYDYVGLKNPLLPPMKNCFGDVLVITLIKMQMSRFWRFLLSVKIMK